MTTFDEFIQKLPNLKRATSAEDGERILAFLKRHAGVQKRFGLFYDRSPDFYALLHLSSPDHFVLTYQGDDGDLEGVTSFTLLRGHDFDTLYVGDFKVKAKSREMKARWRTFADEFMEKVNTIEEFRAVKFIYLVMMDDNTKAYERLIASNILSFRYKKLLGYKMVNVIGQKIWNKFRDPGLSCTISPASEESLFVLLRESSEKRFGSNHPELLRHRARLLCPLASIVEVKDSEGRVLLRASLVDVAPAKRIQILKLPLLLKLLTKLLPLFKGKSYVEGRALDILYLSQLHFHSSLAGNFEAMSTVLIKAMKETMAHSPSHYHMLSFSLFPPEEGLLTKVQEHFLTQVEPLGLYQIIPSWGREHSSEILPNFEMSYV